MPSPVARAVLSGSAGLQPASLQPSFPRKRTTSVIPAEAGSVRHSRESGNPSSSSGPTFARSKSWQQAYPRAGDKPPRYRGQSNFRRHLHQQICPVAQVCNLRLCSRHSRKSGQCPPFPRKRTTPVIPAKAGIHPLFHPRALPSQKEPSRNSQSTCAALKHRPLPRNPTGLTFSIDLHHPVTPAIMQITDHPQFI